MKTRHSSLVSLLALVAAPLSANAALLVVDYNDLTTNAVNGQAGGTGFTGNWTGSSNPTVISGNLSSSLYNITQSGTAQRLRGNTGGVRMNYRTPATTLTGEVWFSFLTQVKETATGLSYESAGIVLNPSTTLTPFNDRGNFYVVQTGDQIEYSFGAGTAGILTGLTGGVPNGDPVVNTFNSLFVGQIIINGGGAADTINVWHNPDLIANADITSYTPFYSNSTVNALDSINLIAAAAYQAAGSLGGGELDSIRFSDGGGDAAQAFLDVTGIAAAAVVVPEPSSMLLICLSLPALLLRRRN